MNADFRIESVQKAAVCGSKVKLFEAYKKDGNRFVFAGQFSAPRSTPNKDLWKIAAERIAEETFAAPE